MFEHYLEEHELVERIVPLHEEDATRRGGAEVAVAVVRVLAHAGSEAVARLRHSLGRRDPPGD